MRTIKKADLANERPEFVTQLKEAYHLIVPEIKHMVGLSLSGAPLGAVAIHSSFLKIEEIETKEIFYTELQIAFFKVTPSAAVHGLAVVNLYDTVEAYEAASKKIKEESVRIYGNENFPTFKDFKGKKLES